MNLGGVTARMKMAEINAKGGILLGRNVVVDGPADRLIRVVTHIHQDHLIGLRYNIKRSLYVVATPTTLEMLEILGYKIPIEKKLPLDYRKPVKIDEETITLIRARHIAGSAQVLVEGKDYRVGYTGDFKLPGTAPMENLDVLVIDATYGSPLRSRKWSEWEAIDALLRIIEERRDKGPIWIYGFNGKLQEIMVELRARGVSDVFVADSLTIKLMKTASRFYGIDVGNIMPLSDFIKDEPAIVFVRNTMFKTFKRRSGTHIRLTGREFRNVAVQVSENVFNVSFSDHATFKEVIEYVTSARPKMVIVDGYRSKDAYFTAKYIEKRLGVKSIVEP